MKYKKAISPVIAVIIIIAVTIAIAVAVAGWMMGLWGAYTATEALTIMPDSYGTTSDSNSLVYLHIRNGGTADAVIYKVVVGGVEKSGTVFSSGTAPGEFTSSVDSVTISAGGSGWVAINFGTDLTMIAGNTYSVTVYTTAGKMYQAVIVAK